MTINKFVLQMAGVAMIASFAVAAPEVSAKSENKHENRSQNAVHPNAGNSPASENHKASRDKKEHDSREKDRKGDGKNKPKEDRNDGKDSKCKDDCRKGNQLKRDDRKLLPCKLLKRHKFCQPTSTPTSASATEAVEDKEAGIRVTTTDNRDVTRPGHSLTYTITVENTGEADIHDLRIANDVPGELTVTEINNGGVLNNTTIVWNNLTVDASGKKSVSFTATVKGTVKDGTLIHNSANAKSEDHDVSDEDTDSTTVDVAQKAAVAGAHVAPRPVPVSAKTGATGMLALLSALSGGSGLAYVIRKFI